MKILLLCNKPPYPASEGGPMAMNSIITGLLEAGHQVKILAVNSPKYNVKESDIPEDYRKKTGIELIDVDLMAERGKVASKVCVGSDYLWCRERQDIDKKFHKADGTKLFRQYVIGNPLYGSDWEHNNAWYQKVGQ